MEETKLLSMCERLPFVFDWVNFKGEDCVGQFNVNASERAGKPMIDISHCMTVALNGIVDMTVQFDKSKFKPSRFGNAWILTSKAKDLGLTKE